MKSGKVFILTGAQGEGKTGRLVEVIDLLQDAGIIVRGFYAKGYWGENVRNRFDIVDIQSGKSALLCSEENQKDFQLYGRFYFNPKTVDWGNTLLLSGKQQVIQKQLAVIDEVGRFEMKGWVWSAVLKQLLSSKSAVLLVVRDCFVNDVIQKFGMVPDKIFSVKTNALEISYQLKALL